MISGQRKTLPKGRGWHQLPFALAGGFSLFLAFNAGLLVMLTLANFLEDAAAGALPLKPFERTFQGLIFADTNLGHCYPSPRSINVLPAAGHTDGRQNRIKIIQPIVECVNLFSKFIPER